MEIKNKKAWVAVTEAVLGIVILFTFVMISLGNQKQESREMDFNGLFLKEIENNQDLRDNILANKSTDVNLSLHNFLSKFNQNYDLDICIKSITESCSSNIQDKEVTAMDFFVAANSTERDYKKLRIFLWRK